MSLTVGDGELVVLLGPTGAGKTTLLRLIAGLERADAGRIYIGGRDATREPPAARDVTFVFQQYSLYPHLTVFDNLAFPLRAPTRGASRGPGQAAGARKSPGWCASTTSSPVPPPGCPAARCSAWRSGGRWCAAPPYI